MALRLSLAALTPMIIRPRPHWYREALTVLPSHVTDGLFIECEVVRPPSSEGRNATLWIPPELADLMLRALRDYGIERRKVRNADS